MKSAIESLTLSFLMPGLLIVGAFAVVKAQPGSEFPPSKGLFLTATVSGENGFLTNLAAEDFEVYVENKRAAVTSIKQEDEPVSVGFLVDVSASMRAVRSGKPDGMVFGVKGFFNFLANANRANDYFVMTFGKDVRFVLDSTQDLEKFKKTLEGLAENKLRESDTKFYDALKMGFEKIKGAKHQKKVLVLISDGQNNGPTKLDLGDVRRLVEQSDVLLYVVRVISDEFFQDSPALALSLRKVPVFERDYKRLQYEISPFPTDFHNEFLYSVRFLNDLSSASGGRSFYPLNQAETNNAFEVLANELKSQYQINVDPPAALKKDRPNEVKIKLPKPKDTKKVSVRARKEIYF